VRTGKFREDLFYRIRVIHLKLPPLRQRREDIPLLVNHLVAKYNRLQNKDIVGVSDEVMHQLLNHAYPGNVRELENIIEQAFVLCRGGIIELHHVPPELRPAQLKGASIVGGPRALRSMEQHAVTEALLRHQGNRKRAAQDLGIDTSTLYRKIKALGIEPPSTDGRSRKRKPAEPEH
jgi:DNA-binding NtrC family response regulator